MNSKILIICGDPNSINSEIIFKAWKSVSKKQKQRVILIGNFKLLSDQAKKLKIKVPIRKINNINEKITKVFSCSRQRSFEICNWLFRFSK